MEHGFPCPRGEAARVARREHRLKPRCMSLLDVLVQAPAYANRTQLKAAEKATPRSQQCVSGKLARRSTRDHRKQARQHKAHHRLELSSMGAGPSLKGLHKLWAPQPASVCRGAAHQFQHRAQCVRGAE
eukprot:12984375-Alexandrium_andersonii.AAC.1